MIPIALAVLMALFPGGLVVADLSGILERGNDASYGAEQVVSCVTPDGVANAIPVLIAAASRVPGVAPSTGVAAVMSGGGAGYLVAPPLVGSVAQGFGLAPGLAMIAACGLAVALAAARRGWSDGR